MPILSAPKTATGSKKPKTTSADDRFIVTTPTSTFESPKYNYTNLMDLLLAGIVVDAAIEAAKEHVESEQNECNSIQEFVEDTGTPDPLGRFTKPFTTP